jgi:SAM-dependent methyltransferase
MTEHAARRRTISGAIAGLLKSAVFRLRVSAARLIYDRILLFLLTDVEWCCRFYPLLDSDFGKQVLIVGPHSFAFALSFAPHHPRVCFVAIEPQGGQAYTRSAQRQRLHNVNFIEVPSDAPLPFTHESFDTIICNFALHRLMPVNKIALLRGLAPLLRAGGRLHLVELDRPTSAREGKILSFAALLWGTEAVAPHFDDSWRKYLPAAGLRALGHERSFSIVAGRVSVIVAGHKRSGAKPMRRTQK